MSVLIGICGGPSSGKTTLSRALTNELCLLGHNAEQVTEYARFHTARCSQYPVNHPRDLLYQYMVLEKQLEWENAIPQTMEYVVSDSPVIIGMIYTHALTNFEDYNQVAFYHLHYQHILQHKNRYNPLFYLPYGDIEFKLDGLRNQDAGRAQRIGEKIKAFLVFHDISFHEVVGTLDERIEKCISIIKG